MSAIDYNKYSNMTQRQILNSLIKAEKQEQKIKKQMQEKLSQKQELIKFLKTKMKESLDKPKYYTLENSPAIKQIRKDFENLPKEQQMELEKELEMELSNANYSAS